MFSRSKTFLRSIHTVNSILQGDYKEALSTIEASNQDSGKHKAELFLQIAEQALHKVLNMEVCEEIEKDLNRRITELRKESPEELEKQQEKYESLIHLSHGEGIEKNIRILLFQAGVDAGKNINQT